MPRKGDSQEVTNALQAKAVADLNAKFDTLGESLKEGFKGVHDRQDITNGKVLRNSEEILLLKAAKWYERSLAAIVTVLVGVVVYFLTST